MSLTLSIVTSCSRELSPDEFDSYIQSRTDLIQTADLGSGIMSRVKLVPSQIILNDRLKRNSLTAKEADTLITTLNDHLYVLIELSTLNGGALVSLLEKELGLTKDQILDYFRTKGSTDYFLLTTEGDTIKSQLYEYEYSYNITPYERFNLVFPKPEDSNWPITLKVPHPITGMYHDFQMNDKFYNDLPKIKFQ